ncbi:hypothetical protein G7054_g5430 [Neopestalotiopsis clavispora]|nr:hypothetical protein G7054_g5430 [Neopestalotiopsis clavispora]
MPNQTQRTSASMKSEKHLSQKKRKGAPKETGLENGSVQDQSHVDLQLLGIGSQFEEALATMGTRQQYPSQIKDNNELMATALPQGLGQESAGMVPN